MPTTSKFTSALLSVTLLQPYMQTSERGISNINDWMRASRLRLNPTKTQVMWLDSSQQLKLIIVSDIPSPVNTAESRAVGSRLGVTLDSQLSLSVSILPTLPIASSCIRSLTADAAKTLIQAFI